MSNKLIAGDYMAGYYGKVNGLITGTDLCSNVGLTAVGIIVSGDITWLKFSHNYKTLFVADRPIASSVSWDIIQEKDLVKGKVVTIGDKIYLCRLMTGGNSNPASYAGGEWNDLIVRFTPDDTDSNWKIGLNICKEICYSSISSRVFRGLNSVTHVGQYSSNAFARYRPVLELL